MFKFLLSILLIFLSVSIQAQEKDNDNPPLLQKIALTQIGSTTYDFQSNKGMARRVATDGDKIQISSTFNINTANDTEFWILSVTDSDENTIVDTLYLPNDAILQVQEDTIPPLIFANPYVLLQGQNLEDAIVNFNPGESIYSLFPIFKEVDVIVGTSYIDITQDFSGNVGIAERTVIVEGDCSTPCGVGIEDNLLQSKITLHPNPTQTRFFLDFHDGSDPFVF